MFFVVFSFGPSCFLNDLQDSHLHRMAKSMMHRCTLIESMSYLGGAMHQCPNCRHYLSWWEKTAATPQVRVDTPTKPHEAASPKMDDGQGLVGLVKWFSNKTYKKKDTRMMKIILSVSSTLFETGSEWIGCALLRECILGMANFMFEFLESSSRAIWNLAIDHDTGCFTFVRTRSSSALMSKSHGNKHM